MIYKMGYLGTVSNVSRTIYLLSSRRSSWILYHKHSQVKRTLPAIPGASALGPAYPWHSGKQILGERRRGPSVVVTALRFQNPGLGSINPSGSWRHSPHLCPPGAPAQHGSKLMEQKSAHTECQLNTPPDARSPFPLPLHCASSTRPLQAFPLNFPAFLSSPAPGRITPARTPPLEWRAPASEQPGCSGMSPLHLLSWWLPDAPSSSAATPILAQ